MEYSSNIVARHLIHLFLNNGSRNAPKVVQIIIVITFPCDLSQLKQFTTIRAECWIFFQITK